MVAGSKPTGYNDYFLLFFKEMLKIGSKIQI